MTLKRALISVYYKKAIVNFARKISEHKIETIATDGTFKIFKEAEMREVKHGSDVTEFLKLV